MPKIIDHLGATILQTAKEMLLKNGYAALTMRAVASRCGIAVGTVYNYYSSKEMLAGRVLLDDWQAERVRMEKDCAAAADLAGGLRALYGGVKRFSDRYSSVWEQYSFSGAAKREFRQRHRLLVRQLAGCLQPVLRRAAPDCPGDTDIFLAENVLICAGGSEMTLDTLLTITEHLQRPSPQAPRSE